MLDYLYAPILAENNLTLSQIDPAVYKRDITIPELECNETNVNGEQQKRRLPNSTADMLRLFLTVFLASLYELLKRTHVASVSQVPRGRRPVFWHQLCRNWSPRWQILPGQGQRRGGTSYRTFYNAVDISPRPPVLVRAPLPPFFPPSFCSLPLLLTVRDDEVYLDRPCARVCVCFCRGRFAYARYVSFR